MEWECGWKFYEGDQREFFGCSHRFFYFAYLAQVSLVELMQTKTNICMLLELSRGTPHTTVLALRKNNSSSNKQWSTLDIRPIQAASKFKQ